MTLAPLPNDLRTWLTPYLPASPTAVDVSWPQRACSRVWRVTADATVAYVKVVATEQGYVREKNAYRHASRFAPHEIPRLLAADESLRAIMTTPVPGQVARRLDLTPETEHHAHHRAGALLRRWHDLPEPVTTTTREAIQADLSAQAGDAAESLRRAARHLTDVQTALVQRVVGELPGLAERVPLAYRHADYSPRNWLIDVHRDQPPGIALIDFEEAAPGPAIADLVWLHGALWLSRPDLRAAFLTGYGRPLNDAEIDGLHLLTARTAVSYLAAGLTQHNHELIDRGRTALHQLTAGTRHP